MMTAQLKIDVGTMQPTEQHAAQKQNRTVGFAAFITVVFAFLVACVGGPQQSWAQNGLGIAAVVNDDAISMLDLNARITMILEASKIPNTAESRTRVAHQVLRGLIDEKLKIQETRRLGIKISQADLQQALDHIASNNKMTVPDLSSHLQSIGVPFSALSSQLEADLAWQMFTNRRLAKRIQVGDEEIKDEINRIQANAGKPEYLLAEIYLPIDNPNQDTNVRNVSQRLLQQLREGAPFSALAKNFSRAPSAAVGGDMGWVQYANLPSELQQVVTQMKPGTASKPVRSLGGYYLLHLRDVRTSPGVGGNDATLKLSQYHIPLNNTGTPATANTVSTQLMAATRGMTTCAQLEAAGAQSGSIMSGSLGEMKLSTLPKNLQNILAPLQVGQPSRPVATGGGLAVMMICERTDESPDADKIKSDIRLKLVKSRLDVAAQRKLRDLRRDAFVDIRL